MNTDIMELNLNELENVTGGGVLDHVFGAITGLTAGTMVGGMVGSVGGAPGCIIGGIFGGVGGGVAGGILGLDKSCELLKKIVPKMDSTAFPSHG